MAKPILCVVDDDQDTVQHGERDLEENYGGVGEGATAVQLIHQYLSPILPGS